MVPVISANPAIIGATKGGCLDEGLFEKFHLVVSFVLLVSSVRNNKLPPSIVTFVIPVVLVKRAPDCKT